MKKLLNHLSKGNNLLRYMFIAVTVSLFVCATKNIELKNQINQQKQEISIKK